MHSSDKEELKSLIEKLFHESTLKSEDDQERIVEAIEKISPDPEILDYIFWSNDKFWEDGKVKAHEIVEKAFAYKPIILGDQSQKDPENS